MRRGPDILARSFSNIPISSTLLSNADDTLGEHSYNNRATYSMPHRNEDDGEVRVWACEDIVVGARIRRLSPR